ncbi:MAG: DUF4911 domain-containing protein [Candidatus Cloacimonadota bacterium]|nr:DUF4911 domain-containing protein [Candidatus Cloacimonadota bacterium]
MNFERISEKIISDGSTEIMLKIGSKDLILLGYILEAFEGFCNFTTADRKKMQVKIVATQYYVNDINRILTFLKKFNPNVC